MSFYSVRLRFFSRFAAAVCLAVAALAPSLFADPLNADLSAYSSAPGLSASVNQDVLTVTWSGADNATMRVQYVIQEGQPMLRELAVRPAGGEWAPLESNLTPEFTVHTGRRRLDFTGVRSLKDLGVDNTSQAVIDHYAWTSFWDAPFVVPGDPNRNPGLPRTPDEIGHAPAVFNASSCAVKTDGARIEVSFPGLEMGMFSGGLRFTHYRGTNLLRMEAIAQTQQNMVAYKYDAGLKGISTERLPRVRWLDTGGNGQQYQFGGGRHDGPVAVRAKGRTMIAEGPSGSIGVFPPPTVFFPGREVDTNLGYVWYRKDSEGSYAFGVKQADHEDNERFVDNFALYNAPPGTMQRMATYFYLSPADAMATRDAVMALTNNDTFAPVEGYKTMVNHFHLRFTDGLRASGSMNTQSPDLAAMRALGLNIIGMSDFHADQLARMDPGPQRFVDQKDYFEGTRRASDTDFLVIPWEEPELNFGGHVNLINPRPLYFSLVREEGQSFNEQEADYGNVYHLNGAEDSQRMLEAEGAYWYTAHPRTKSSISYPDAYWDKSYAKSDHFLGIAFKPGMGMDLSEVRLAEWRTFDALDTMNNQNAGSGLKPKVLIGDVDTYQKWPHDDLLPGFVANYLKLDRVPGPDEDWSPIIDALSDGDFFVTTGEIFIRNFAVEGSGAQRTVVADVDWTFPLEFVEVVWGDGESIDRQVIRATDLDPNSSKRFAIPFDATGKKWVRFAVWDSAVNGAFVQPVWLE